MWASWNRRTAQDDKFIETTRSLLQDTLQRLIYGSAVVLFIWFFITGQSSAELLLWKFWLVFAVSIFIVRLCVGLVSRKLIAAAVIWLGGLFAINTLFVFLLQRPEAIFFYALIPLQAAIVLGWQSSVVATAFVGAALLGVGQFSGQSYPEGYLIVVFASSVSSAFLGWISSSSLLNEVKNSLYFSRLAQRNLEEAREHRGQMFKLLKDLDMAYYRLERANAALVAAWKEAETAEKFKAEFVTYVSHEMRTPLNLIAGFSEAILTSPESYGSALLPGPYRADVNKINQNASHLLALIEDVIDLSRANVNRIPLTREKVDVKGLVHESVEMVRDYIETKGLTLIVAVDESLDILFVDRLRIRQVLLNLLVNAARFTSSGSIRVEGNVDGLQAIFKISDTGRGIGPGEIDRIFEEYHTSGNQEAVWHSGSGLGLPISKKLIELHGGKMGVENGPQPGATFWFSLPLETDSQLVKERPFLAPFSALPYQPSTRDRTVVLAHADPGAGRILQRASRGLRVQQAADWPHAVELAREIRAQALIAAANVAGNESLPNGMVWIEFPLPGTQLLAEKLGAAEVLEKPVTKNDLIDAVDRVSPEAQKILIVDDDIEITELFQRFLSPRCSPGGCRIASNGREALACILKERPDLVILDLVMPDMDGYQVIEELRALRAQRAQINTPPIPILVISGTVGDIYDTRIETPVKLHRIGGLRLGESIQAIEAVVTALSPGWE